MSISPLYDTPDRGTRCIDVALIAAVTGVPGRKLHLFA